MYWWISFAPGYAIVYGIDYVIGYVIDYAIGLPQCNSFKFMEQISVFNCKTKSFLLQHAQL